MFLARIIDVLSQGISVSFDNVIRGLNRRHEIEVQGKDERCVRSRAIGRGKLCTGLQQGYSGTITRPPSKLRSRSGKGGMCLAEIMVNHAERALDQSADRSYTLRTRAGARLRDSLNSWDVHALARVHHARISSSRQTSEIHPTVKHRYLR